MADIANQLEGAVEGLDRFLEALDNSSMKLGSNAAVESKLARAAHKKAQQDLRFRKKIEKMEKETTKREAQHLAQLKAMQPLRQKLFAGLKQELKAKSDLIKQTKGLGDALKKTGAGLGGMFKALGSGISKAMSGLGAGFKGGIESGLKGVWENLKGINIAGFSVGKMIGGVVAGVKLLYEVLSTNEKLMNDITKQTGLMGDTFRDKYKKEVMETYAELGKYGYTIKETVKLTQDMREAFGDVSYVTQDMVKTSAELQMTYRMSADNANELVETMARSGYESDKFLKTMEKTAIVMGADVGMAMRDVAKNTQMMELYAGRGEEYFAKMATRAAMLGTDMQSIEDSGKAFEDFDQMSENFGKMSQLFGAGFSDGLKSLTEIRMMYERGNMLGIQEHIAEQTAKTLYYEDGILKSMKTKDILYQSQIKNMAATMGMDNVSALRAIKAAKMQEMMNTKGFAIEKEMLKTKESKEIFAASEYDYSMAMFSALRDAGKDEEFILKKLNEEGKTTKQILADRKELVSIAEDEMIHRADIAKEQEGLAKKTEATMQDLKIAMNESTTSFNMMVQKLGEGGEKIVGDVTNQMKEISVGVNDGLQKGLNEWKDDASTMSNISNVMGEGTKGGIAAAFDNITPQMLEGKGAFKAIEMAMVSAIGGKPGEQGVGGVIFDQLVNGTDYLGKLLTRMWRWLEDIFHKVLRDTRIAFDMGLDDSAQIRADWQAGVDERKLEREQADEQADSENALGRSGGRSHRGIVGEAGTEVGITRSALRELSSAGIPGYANGTYFGDLTTNRAGQPQGAGTVGGRMGRERSNQGEAARYQNTLNNFLSRQDEQQTRDRRERQDIWARDTKQFFTDYPAMVDEAIGAPFRQGGPVSTGLYNSIFSGMQASTRAELAGGSKDQQRQLMYQHMTAEGMKPGGIIDQGMDKLSVQQSKLTYVLEGGVEIEQKKADELRATWIKSSDAYMQALSSGDKKKIAELGSINDLNYEALKVQKEQVGELRELQKRGEGWNRATVGLLGGIQSGLAMGAGVIAGGGSAKQARKAAGRGLLAGVIKDLSGQFGTADQEFLGQFNTIGALMGTMPGPRGGGNAGDIISQMMSQTEATFQSQGRGLSWGGANAQGRVYNSPHLAMVGEGSQNEVIIPTERIRKGLPINAGVARELGSIGVPGYWEGGLFEQDTTAGMMEGTSGMVGFGGTYAGGADYYGGRGGAAMSNLKGSMGGGLATGGLQMANVLMQGGDMRSAAASGIGAGVGFAATAALTPFLGPFAGLAGSLIGGFVGKGLGKLFAKKPKYGRYRGRAIKQVEDHIEAEGRFRIGQPAGVEDNFIRAISGKQRDKPSEKHYEKLKAGLLQSGVAGRALRPKNVDQFIGLLSGQTQGGQADQLRSHFNNLFYGTPMAAGGIVTGPTRAVIGEKGPEAVIPLDRYGGFPSQQQQQNSVDMVNELKTQNRQTALLIKSIRDSKTVLQVDGRQLAETVGQNMYDINTGL